MMRTDNLSKQEIEDNCNCAGVLLFMPSASTDGSDLKVLLVESKRKKYQYSFPKGKRNKGEPTLDTAKRECYEETGLTEADYELYDVKWYVEYRVDIEKPHIVYYLGKLKNMDAKLDPKDTKEIVSAGWYTPEEIYKMKDTFYLQRRQIVSRAIKDISFKLAIEQQKPGPWKPRLKTPITMDTDTSRACSR
jgi:8-oxo-dGTP pyrophosphatase MutT (NUDIX family)